MRITKEAAKQVTLRPTWLVNNRNWDLFVDYRDSEQSADDLATLYIISRAQAQNIVRNIIVRSGRPGELSTRAVNILKEWGVTFAPEKLEQELTLLATIAIQTSGSLEAYLLTCREGCGRKTVEEILRLYEDLPIHHRLNPAA